jgi:tripartite ATP-independent transporter DctP family solute receptor
MRQGIRIGVLALLTLHLISSAALAGQLVLKFAAEENKTHKFYPTAVQFAKDVEDQTKGAVKIELYFGAQLGDAVELMEGIQMGTIDLTAQASKIGKLERAYEVFDLPFLTPDAATARKILDGPIGKEMAQGFAKKETRLLAYWELGFRQITNNVRPVVVPGDLKGMKIRVPDNKLRMTTFETFGASVSVTTLAELYLALQQGVLDGTEQPLGTIWSNRFFEVQKYLSISNHVFTPGYLLVREESWKRIPKEWQGEILKAAAKSQDMIRKLSDEEDSQYVDKLKERGMKVNTIDAKSFQEVGKKLWEKEGKRFGDLPKRILAAQ